VHSATIHLHVGFALRAEREVNSAYCERHLDIAKMKMVTQALESIDPVAR
jgi:hypothetical protein